jgi:adrenodoxin-NADP+ reductase
VTIVGRRGHVQGAFTIKELRELTKLEKEGFGASFLVREDELEMGTTEASLEELAGPGGRPKGRMDKLLRSVATNGT